MCACRQAKGALASLSLNPTVSHRYSGWLGQFIMNEVMQQLDNVGTQEISNKTKFYRL